MALTFTSGSIAPVYAPDGVTRRAGTLTIASYTAAGEPIVTPFPGRTVKEVVFHEPITSQGFFPRFDGTKVRVYRPTGNAAGQTTDTFAEVLGGATASAITDQASASVNSAAILALRTMAAETVTTFVAQPDYPRNIVFTIKAVSASADVGDVTVTVAGLDQFGAAATEAFSSQVGSGSPADTKFRRVAGSKIFAAIASVVVAVTDLDPDPDEPAVDLQYSIGFGATIGLTQPLATPASGDVKSVQKNATAVSSGTYSVSTTAMSVNMGANLADGDDVVIRYASNQDLTSGIGEAVAGSNAGSVRCTVGWI